MATTSKVFSRTAAATSSATLYTAPSLTTAIITNIVIANTAATTQTATILLDDVTLVPTITLDPNSVTGIDIKQVLDATKTIKAYASATSVTFHISGVEVS